MADEKFIILHPPSSVPLAISIVAELLKNKLSIKVVPKKENTTTELQILPAGLSLRGNTILRYLARKTNSDFALYGKSLDDPFSTSEVDEWVDFAKEKIDLDVNGNAFDEACSTLNGHLQMRTFLSGYSLSIADIAVFSSLHEHKEWKSKVDSSKGKETLMHLTRWFNFVSSLSSISKFVLSTDSSSTNKVKGEGENNANETSGRSGSQGSFLKLDLPNAKEGEVVTRFPPEPSGYLHIGHAKAALMNNYYATFFKGKLIVRFDDTNPAKEKEEYVENILKDLETLKVKPNKISYTSDFFPEILKYAEQLIKDGLGYIDDTTKEEISKQRDAGIESKRRNNSIEENLRLWNEMVQGTEEGIKCVLRAKLSVTDLNKVLRDPALARCIIDIPHHRTGTKYKVYPLYDFACPIVDSLEGVTHALRSSEYHDRNPLYYWVVDALRIRKPFIQDFSRLNFAYTVLSKRKLQHLVNIGFVSDWNDPRFPTIQGILRRGLTVEALTEFILSQGASKNLNLMEPDKLWALNKSILDPIVPRYTAVASDTKVLFHLSNGPSVPEFKSVPRHKKNPSLGEKILTYTNKIFLEGADAKAIKQGEEVTLMDWGNAIIDSIQDSNNQIVLQGHLHPEGSFKSTEKKLTWLPDIPDLVHVSLVDYGNILTKKKLEEEDDFEKFLNQSSKILTNAIGDPNLRSLKKGDKLQLERRGYFVVDEEFKHNSKPLVLINIPDGHTQKAASVLTSKPQQEKEKNKEKEKK